MRTKTASREMIADGVSRGVQTPTGYVQLTVEGGAWLSVIPAVPVEDGKPVWIKKVVHSRHAQGDKVPSLQRDLPAHRKELAGNKASKLRHKLKKELRHHPKERVFGDIGDTVVFEDEWVMPFTYDNEKKEAVRGKDGVLLFIVGEDIAASVVGNHFGDHRMRPRSNNQGQPQAGRYDHVKPTGNVIQPKKEVALASGIQPGAGRPLVSAPVATPIALPGPQNTAVPAEEADKVRLGPVDDAIHEAVENHPKWKAQNEKAPGLKDHIPIMRDATPRREKLETPRAKPETLEKIKAAKAVKGSAPIPVEDDMSILGEGNPFAALDQAKVKEMEEPVGEAAFDTVEQLAKDLSLQTMQAQKLMNSGAHTTEDVSLMAEEDIMRVLGVNGDKAKDIRARATAKEIMA